MEPPPTADGPAPRDEALDGWRGVACLLVYFAHKAVALDFPPLVVPGSTGVVMFFVLSGYLLGAPFLSAIRDGRPAPSWRRYYARRALRIYPPYVASLGLYLAARAAMGDKLPDATNLVSHLLLAFNYAGASYYYSINAVYWSLAIEAQFYLILPVASAMAAWWARGHPGRASAGLVAGLAVVGVASRAAECLLIGPRSGADGVRYTAVFSHLDWFAAGVAAACVGRRSGPRGRAARLIGGLSLVLAATNAQRLASGLPRGSAADTALAIVAPGLVAAGLGLVLRATRDRPGPGPGWLGFGPLVWVGTVSYSLFLYHIGVQVAVQRLWPMRSIADPGLLNLAQALAALPPALGLSALMFRLVERPCLRAMAGLRPGPGAPVDRAGAP